MSPEASPPDSLPKPFRMNDTDNGAMATWRRRLRFRSWHRGTREADLLLGGFADAHLDGLGQEGLAAFDRLLDVPDPDLWDWIAGLQPVPPEEDGPVIRALLAHCARGVTRP